MPRNRKKPLGTRNYVNYSQQQLEDCLNAVRSGELTQRAAETRYGISRSTIKNKLKDKHPKSVGRSRIFSEEEEAVFEQHLIKLCEYGFPVVELDFRFVIKTYLDKKGVTVDRFKQNLPGYEWTKSFLKRHEHLSVRLSQNIKKARADVNAETINNYISNLSDVVKDVPNTNLWNYDETNLTDDPGSKRVICKRGAKYVENICNHSKSSTSLMFCGNAAGKCLPPYVVYRAENMWSTWTQNGPDGARYNRTKNGWFDAITFEDWFQSIFLPATRKQGGGPHVLIGDNLSSHISLNVLRLCEQNNIRFVCLPPNSTHLTQPLDVAFFAPMKKAWRNILTKWKESSEGSKYTTIPKDLLPTLLKELLSSLKENGEHNLKSGFEKCGIFPLNGEKLLERLPANQSTIDINLVGESFLEQLEKKRSEYLGPVGPKKKKKKVQVPAGKSISVEEVEASLGVSEGNKSLPCTSKSKKNAKKHRKNRKKSVSSSTDESDIDMVLESEFESETFSDIEEILNEKSNNPVCTTQAHEAEKMATQDYAVDNFVIILYNKQQYPGRILSLSDDGPTVECMEKGLKFWRWPKIKDCMEYKWEDIVGKISPPKICSKRNQFTVPELDNFVS